MPDKVVVLFSKVETAPEIRVSGRITDENGAPLAGASEQYDALRARQGKCLGGESFAFFVGRFLVTVTRERIRQIEAKALRKLRHPSRSKRLKSFMET